MINEAIKKVVFIDNENNKDGNNQHVTVILISKKYKSIGKYTQNKSS